MSDNNNTQSNRSDRQYQEQQINRTNYNYDEKNNKSLMTYNHTSEQQPIAGVGMIYPQPNTQQEQMMQVIQVKTGESVNSNLYNNNNDDGIQRNNNILGGERSLPSSGTDNANPVFGTVKSQQKQYNNMLQGTKSLDGGDMALDVNNNSMMGYPPHNNMSNNNIGNNSMGHTKQQMMGFNRRHSEPVEVAINPMNSINYNSSGSSGSSKMGKESLGMMDYNRRHSEPGIDEDAFAPPPHMGRNTSSGSYSRRNSEPAFSLLANIFDQSVQDMDNNNRGFECGNNNNMMSIQEPLEGDMVNNNNDMDHDRELESYIMSKSSDGWSSPPLPTTNTTQEKTMQGYIRGRRRSNSAPLPEDDYMGLRDSSGVVDGWSSPPPPLSDQSGQSSDTSPSKTLEGFRKSRRWSSSAPPPESPDKATLNHLHQALKEPLDGGDNIDNDVKRRDDELESYLSKASEGWSPAQESPSSKPAQEKKKKTMQGYKRNRRRSSSAPRLSDMMQVLTKLEPEPVQTGRSGRSIGSNRSSQRSRSVDPSSRGDGISSQHSSQSSLNSHHYSHMSNDDLVRTEVTYSRGDSFKRRKSEPLLPKDIIAGAVVEGHGGQSQDLHQSLPDIGTYNEEFNLQQATSTDSHTDALMQMLLGSVGGGMHLNSPSTAMPPHVAVAPPSQQTISVPVIHKPPQPQHKGSPLRLNKQAPVVQQPLLLPNQAPMAHQPLPGVNNNVYGQPFQVAPKPFQVDPHAHDLSLILSAVKEAQTNLRTLQAIVIQLGDPQALEDIANAFGVAALSSQFILASDLPNAYAQLNKVWMIIKKVNDVLAYKAMQQQVLGNVNASNLAAMQQLQHGAAGTSSTGMVMPPPLTEGYITSQAVPTQALPPPTGGQPLGVFNSPMQHSHSSTTMPTNTVSKPPIFEPTTPTSSPMASTSTSPRKSESPQKPKGILKSPSPKQPQQTEETIPINDPMARLKAMMERTKKSQQSLEDWDRRNGLPKSHCMTMVNSSRSRQQLQTGTILKKWTGAPLIEIKDDDDDEKGKGEMITVLTVPTSMGKGDKQLPTTDTDTSSHQQDISERSGRSLNSADFSNATTASLYQSQENMDDTSLDSTNELHVKGPIG